MTRRKIVAGNWKMNLGFEEGLALAKAVIEGAKTDNATVILCPPFLHLQAIQALAQGVSGVAVAAQNCYTQKSGAFTGEISAPMLQSIGVQYVLIGHSERREYFAESNAMLAEKVNIALEYGITPIFCCGEPLEIRQADTYKAYVGAQIQESLFHLSAEDFAKIVIAYEPIWAIGTGMTASPQQAQETQAALRSIIAQQYGEELADATTILYGGSVKASSAAELFSCPDVDGGLVGGASLSAAEFIEISKAF